MTTLRFALLLTVCALIGAQEASLQLSPVENWRLTTRSGSPSWAQLEYTADETRVRIAERTRGFELRLSSADASMNLPILSAMTFSCDLRAGVGLAMRVVVRDALGESLVFADQPLALGVNNLRWDLIGVEAENSWGGKRNLRLDGTLAQLVRFELVRDEDVDDPVVDLTIGEVRAHCLADPVAVLQVDVDTGTPYHVLRTDRNDRLALVVRNPSDSTVTAQVALRVEGVDRSVQEPQRELTIAAGETIRWEDFVTVSGYGQWFVDYSLRATDSDKSVKGLLSFARMQPAGPTPFRREGFQFGVNGGIPENGSSAKMDSAAEAIAIAGIKVVRTSLVWEALQYGGRKSWAMEKVADYGRMIDAAQAQGIECQVLLGYGVPWNAPEADQKSGHRADWQFSPPNHGDMQAWLDYVNLMVTTFGDRVRYWEVWNEPDLWHFWQGSSDDYIELLRTTYQAIKAKDPAHQVLTGGFALLDGHGGHKEPGFQRNVCVKAEPYYDILAHHRHGHIDGFMREVDGPLAAIRAELKDPAKPLWFNETAINTPDDRYRAQAAGLVKKITFGWSRGSSGHVWYQMISGDLSLQSRRKWGLMASGHYPKPNYVAYNALVHQLGQQRHDVVFERSGDRRALGFAPMAENGGDYVTVLWDDYAWQPQDLVTLAVGESSVSVVDMMGNAAPLAVHQGVVVLDSSLYPRYLRSSGAQRPQVLAPMVSLGERLTAAAPGRDYALAVRLQNPLAAPISIDFTWFAVPGVADGSVTARVVVPAGGEVVEAFALPIAADFDLPYGDFHDLHLQYAVADTPWRGTLTVPLEPAVMAGVEPDRAADVVLEEYRYVRNRFENNPGSDHLTWQGRDDLSLQAWFTRRDDALEVRVAVRDEQYSSVAGDWGQSDCVEVMVAPAVDQGRRMGIAHQDGDTVTLRGDLAEQGATVTMTTEPGLRNYTFTVPLVAFGADADVLADGFRVNIAARDRDGDNFKGWIQMAPLLEHWTTTGDVTVFPVVVVE
ncbi:MAG: family 1 glycosylhydrolase [Planctomycetota bacterium]|jgi:hypothetical protein|nr:family 1 glycosylhydrolase [Planctomycetota bacterium]